VVTFQAGVVGWFPQGEGARPRAPASSRFICSGRKVVVIGSHLTRRPCGLHERLVQWIETNEREPARKVEIVMPDAAEPVTFETDIKPLFRERDQRSMRFAFDLASYDDVREYADAILARLREGSMPCDGAWPQAQVDLFERWTETGKGR
jgi:hypothetical protein